MNNKIFVPPIKIQGIKTKLVPAIKQCVSLNRDTVWIEPFMGSGVVGFNIAPNKAIFADCNPCIIDFYNQIKEKKITSYIIREFLEQEGALLSEKGDDYYYEVRNRFNNNRNPLDFLFLNRSCFNGMIRFNKDNNFNVPFGHKPQRFSKAYITKIINQVKYIETELSCKDWIFLCQSFDETLVDLPENSFIYCDPPYIGRHVDYYDSWNEQSEIKLHNCLVTSDKPFILSTWDYNQYRSNEYIQKIWGLCNKINIEHFYYVGAKEENRKPIVEALLSNYKITALENKALELKDMEQLTFDCI
ncbi:MAG: Dam family site-specific DNA-(adenine-N6)-methyltransferase [Acutalibacteraceae bacterium]